MREAERATKALADELRVAEQQRGSTGSELEQSLRAANAALRDSELRLAGETERCARETERARAAERDCDDYVVRVNEQAETIGALEEGAEGRAGETAALRERLEAAEAASDGERKRLQVGCSLGPGRWRDFSDARRYRNRVCDTRQV